MAPLTADQLAVKPVDVITVAVLATGAAMAVAVVTLIAVELPEIVPAEFTARTRYLYAVAALRPVTTSLVAVTVLLL